MPTLRDVHSAFELMVRDHDQLIDRLAAVREDLQQKAASVRRPSDQALMDAVRTFQTEQGWAGIDRAMALCRNRDLVTEARNRRDARARVQADVMAFFSGRPEQRLAELARDCATAMRAREAAEDRIVELGQDFHALRTLHERFRRKDGGIPMPLIPERRGDWDKLHPLGVLFKDKFTREAVRRLRAYRKAHGTSWFDTAAGAYAQAIETRRVAERRLAEYEARLAVMEAEIALHERRRSEMDEAVDPREEDIFVLVETLLRDDSFLSEVARMEAGPFVPLVPPRARSAALYRLAEAVGARERALIRGRDRLISELPPLRQARARNPFQNVVLNIDDIWRRVRRGLDAAGADLEHRITAAERVVNGEMPAITRPVDDLASWMAAGLIADGVVTGLDLDQGSAAIADIEIPALDIPPIELETAPAGTAA